MIHTPWQPHIFVLWKSRTQRTAILLEDFPFPQPHLGEDFIAKRPTTVEPAYCYLFYSPKVKAYKIGKTKNGRCLRDRLRERTRQCGETQVLALWKCHPEEVSNKERLLLQKAKPYRTGRETFAWEGDFIELYAVFMQDADWKAYSMDLVLVEGQWGMKNFREEGSWEGF